MEFNNNEVMILIKFVRERVTGLPLCPEFIRKYLEDLKGLENILNKGFSSNSNDIIVKVLDKFNLEVLTYLEEYSELSEINRCKRLQAEIKGGAPELIIQNEIRMLNEINIVRSAIKYYRSLGIEKLINALKEWERTEGKV